MAKNRVISASIALDDAKFQNSIRNINTSLKLVNQQFKEGQSAVNTYGATQQNLTKIQDAYKTKLDLLTKQQENYKKAIENEEKQLQSNIKKRDELVDKIEEQKKTLEDVEKAHGKNSEEYKKEEEALEKLIKQLTTSENAIAKNNNNINKYNTELSKSQTEINKTEGELKQLSDEFNNVGNSSQQLNQTMKSFNINNVVDGIKNVTSSLSNTFDSINSKIIGFGKEAINVGVQFSQSMANVKAVSGATAEEMVDLEQKAKDLGGSTAYSSSQVMDAFGYMSLAGWEVSKSLNEVEGMLKITTVAGEDLATMSDLITDSMSAMGAEAQDSTKYYNALATAQANSNTNVKMMLEAYIGAGGMFKSVNTPLAESASILGVLANNGIKGSDAGTALNSMLTNLQDSSSTTAKAFKEMGVQVYDAQGNFRGFETILKETQQYMANATDEQKKFISVSLGGKTQIDTFNALISGMADGSYADLKAIIESTTNSLEEQYDIMTNTPEAKIAGLKSQFEALQLKVFDTLTPTMNKAMDSISKFLDKLNGLDDKTMENILSLVKFSLITGVVLKGVNGLAGGVGNVVSLMANFKALTMGTTVATTAMAGATSATATATATAGASIATTGGLVSGLGTALSSVGAFLTGPWGLALVGGAVAVAGLAYAVKKGSEDCIESVDLWADETIKDTQIMTDAYGNIVKVVNETQVQISENTKNNLQGIIDQHDEHTQKLTEFAMREREITDAEYSELKLLQKQLTFEMSEEDRRSKEERLAILQEKFDSEKEIIANEYAILKEQMDIMTEETNTKLDEKYANEKQKLITYLMEVQGLTAEQAQQELDFMDLNHTIQSENYQRYQEEYYALLQKSYEDENGLTIEEHAKLMELENQLRNYQIEVLSETELEAQLIQNRMKDHALYTSTEQMGQLIKDAETVRVKRIEEANAEYEEYARILTQQKNISGSLTDEQYNDMLEKAKTTRDEKLRIANEEKIGVLEQLEEMNKESYDKLDHNTGEMIGKWEQFWGGMKDETEENAHKAIADLDSYTKKVNSIPNTQTKTVNIVTNYKTVGTPVNSNTKVNSNVTYRMLSEEIATLSLNDNSNYDRLERTINNLTDKVNRAVSSIPDTFNNLVKNMDIINQNNIFIDKKQIIKDVNRGIEEEREALQIAKGSNRIIVR